MSTYPRSIIIKDLSAKFCRISGTDAPVNPFGSKQWEMVIETNDPAKVEELKGYGLNVKQNKDDDKLFSVNLKRKGIKADGNPNAPVFCDIFTTPVSFTSNLETPLSSLTDINDPVFDSEKAAIETLSED